MIIRLRGPSEIHVVFMLALVSGQAKISAGLAWAHSTFCRPTKTQTEITPSPPSRRLPSSHINQDSLLSHHSQHHVVLHISTPSFCSHPSARLLTQLSVATEAWSTSIPLPRKRIHSYI